MRPNSVCHDDTKHDHRWWIHWTVELYWSMKPCMPHGTEPRKNKNIKRIDLEHFHLGYGANTVSQCLIFPLLKIYIFFINNDPKANVASFTIILSRQPFQPILPGFPLTSHRCVQASATGKRREWLWEIVWKVASGSTTGSVSIGFNCLYVIWNWSISCKATIYTC